MKKLVSISLLVMLLITCVCSFTSCGFQYHTVGYVGGELSEPFLKGDQSQNFEGYSFEKATAFKGIVPMAKALQNEEIQYLLANKATTDAILSEYSDIKALSATLNADGETVYVLTMADNTALDGEENLSAAIALFQKTVMGYVEGDIGAALLSGAGELDYEFHTSKIKGTADQVAKALRNHKAQYLVVGETLADQLLADIAAADAKAAEEKPDAKAPVEIKKTVDMLTTLNGQKVVLLSLADNTAFDSVTDAWEVFTTMQKVPVIGYAAGEASEQFLKDTALENMPGYETKSFDSLTLMTEALTSGNVDFFLANDTTAEALMALDASIKMIPTPLAGNGQERVMILTLSTNTTFDQTDDVVETFADLSKSSFQVEWDLFYSKLIKYNGYKDVLNGLATTMKIAVIGLLIGIVIGTLIALIKMIPKYHALPRILSAICDVYVGFFRGTPMVVQLLIGWFILLPELGLQLNNEMVAIAVFGMNSGAYVSEIMRSGIQAVDGGQLEAARAVGLGYWVSMMKVVIPQGIKNILPTLGNEFIVLVKDTSIVSFIAVVDITKALRQIGDANYSYIIPYLTLALIYLVIVIIFTFLIKLLERRLAKSERRK